MLKYITFSLHQIQLRSTYLNERKYGRNTVWHGMVGMVGIWYGMTGIRYDMAWWGYGMAENGYGIAWYGYGMVGIWYGMSWKGYGMA